IWPLYQVEYGTDYTLSPESRRIADGVVEKKPVTEWFASQGRFRHLKDERWAPVVDEIQGEVDRRWKALLKRCGL
ncbi:MAG: pyruvate ferredoxin oxidoreductase, partial [Candidatus Methanomethylophilus sp.]|nr:pyruvate ferredoxin oxidoreductase [Methanomethylophilus sp.]